MESTGSVLNDDDSDIPTEIWCAVHFDIFNVKKIEELCNIRCKPVSHTVAY